MEAAKSSIFIYRPTPLRWRKKDHTGLPLRHRIASTHRAQSFHGKRTHLEFVFKGPAHHPNRSPLFSHSHGFLLEIRGAAISHIHIWRASNDSHAFNFSINHSNHIISVSSRPGMATIVVQFTEGPPRSGGPGMGICMRVCVCEFADLQPDMCVCVRVFFPTGGNQHQEKNDNNRHSGTIYK